MSEQMNQYMMSDVSPPQAPPSTQVFTDQSYISKLHTCLWNMREQGHLCDVMVKVGSLSLPAHKCILLSTSEYLLGFQNSSPNIPEFNIVLDRHIEFHDLLNIIRYMYTGELEINKNNYSNMLSICAVLKLETATSYIFSYINKLVGGVGDDSTPEQLKEDELKHEMQDAVEDDVDKDDNTIEASANIDHNEENDPKTDIELTEEGDDTDLYISNPDVDDSESEEDSKPMHYTLRKRTNRSSKSKDRTKKKRRRKPSESSEDHEFTPVPSKKQKADKVKRKSLRKRSQRAEAVKPTVKHDSSDNSATSKVEACSNELKDRFTCSTCSEVFSNTTYLRIHNMVNHTHKWVGLCHHKHCEYLSRERGDLASHLYIKHRELTMEYPLQMCTVEFCKYIQVNPKNYKHHRQMHEKAGQECKFEPIKVERAENGDAVFDPKIDMLEEVTLKLLDLKYSKRLFNIPAEETRTKTGEWRRVLPCHLCDEDFESIRPLRFHILGVHDGKWVGRCPLSKCDYMTDSKDDLASHRFMKHSESTTGYPPLHCKVDGCSYSCCLQGDLDKHTNSHNKTTDTKVDTSTDDVTMGDDSVRTRSSRNSARSKQYKCNKCSAMFHTEHMLRCHRNEGHKNQGVLVQCNHCDDFTSYGKHGLTELAKHMEENHFEEANLVHQCEVEGCEYVANSTKYLITHMKNEHKIFKTKKANCKFCGASVKNMLKHITDVHSKVNNVKCEFPNCGTMCNKKNYYKKQYVCLAHKKEFIRRIRNAAHVPIVPRLMCSACNNRYIGYKDLAEHENKKHGIAIPDKYERLQCDHPGCQYWTLRRDLMEKHVECHSGVMRYTCELCGKSFVSRDSWRKHMRSHRDTKFECDMPACNATFKFKDGLKKHKRNVHKLIDNKFQEKECIKCEKCEYSCYSKTGMTKHNQERHLPPPPPPPAPPIVQQPQQQQHHTLQPLPQQHQPQQHQQMQLPHLPLQQTQPQPPVPPNQAQINEYDRYTRELTREMTPVGMNLSSQASEHDRYNQRIMTPSTHTTHSSASEYERHTIGLLGMTSSQTSEHERYALAALGMLPTSHY
ncbi:unnamed protein product [Owenia fusiformis]|uniref:Uncharacterized protein n=1 Tax=Owenia fusiformis TaxID=6347 RepID=A0A8S4NJ43_OWEFU|nr:unnamed protein product [Owenia fusiformis]